MRILVVAALAASLAGLGVVASTAGTAGTGATEPATVAAKTCPEGYKLNKSKTRCIAIRGSSGSF